MSEIIRLTGWQTVYAVIGDRYQLVFLAQGSNAITSGTVSEFKQVLDMRLGVTVEGVKLLGRVLSADVKVTRSASLLSLFGEYIVAGTPAVTFKLTEVYKLPHEASLAQTISGAATTVASLPATIFNAGKEAGQAVSSSITGAVGGVLPDVGTTVGNTVANVVKPLIVPAIILGAAYMFVFSKTIGRGRYL